MIKSSLTLFFLISFSANSLGAGLLDPGTPVTDPAFSGGGVDLLVTKAIQFDCELESRRLAEAPTTYFHERRDSPIFPIPGISSLKRGLFYRGVTGACGSFALAPGDRLRIEKVKTYRYESYYDAAFGFEKSRAPEELGTILVFTDSERRYGDVTVEEIVDLFDDAFTFVYRY